MIDLITTRLAERGSTWLHAFPLGRYVHPVHGVLTFTRQRLQAIADGVNRGVRGVALALDYDHRQDPAKGGKAAGWIERAEVRGDGLWIAVQLTAEALAEVRAGHWRYLSPEFGTWTDPRTGVEHADVLAGAALTNRPFLRDLAAVAASEGAVHTSGASGGSLVGLGFGGGGRGEPASSRAARGRGRLPVPVGGGGAGAAMPAPVNRLTEVAALTRFMAVLGANLGTSTFDDALEQAAREDPAGYAAYRQSTYVDGAREGW